MKRVLFFGMLIIVGILVFLIIGKSNLNTKSEKIPLILYTWWDELIFVGEVSPVDKKWMTPQGTTNVLSFSSFLKAVDKGVLNNAFSKNKIIGITDEGWFSQAALVVLLARKAGLNNVWWVNSNLLMPWKKMDQFYGNEIDIISWWDRAIEFFDFGKYKLVVKPTEKMLSSGDVLIYLGAWIDLKEDLFSGEILSLNNKVCNIYLGDITDTKGFDFSGFEYKLSRCFNFEPNHLYFYYPKYWYRSAVPILFLLSHGDSK